VIRRSRTSRERRASSGRAPTRARAADGGDPFITAGNRLFQNNGDGTFDDVTLSSGIAPGINTCLGFAVTFADMDGDRYPEILIAADFTTSRYLRNNKDGTFTNVTGPAGLGLDHSGMGGVVADFNNDLLLDWYVTSVDLGIPTNDGNKMYYNLGNHSFEEVALSAGVANGLWGWGTLGVDVDHDGDIDLLETNGWNGGFFNQPAFLWMNNGDGTSFTNQAAQTGLDYSYNGLAIVNLDYDHDGDQDFLFTSAHLGQLRLFRNDLTNGGNWLRMEFDTTPTPDLAPGGFGTRVKVRTGSKWQLRYVDGGDTYENMNELTAHFGLGDATVVDEIVIEWANGEVTQLRDQPVNRHMLITSP